MLPPIRAALILGDFYAWEKKKRNSRKATESPPIDAKTEWREAVNALVQEQPTVLTTRMIRTLIVVLMGYLTLAPTKEDELAVDLYVSQLRDELSNRTRSPLALSSEL